MKTKAFLGILPLVGLLAFNAGAQVVDTVITNGLFEPHSVAADTNNNYYITDSANNRIVKYVQDTAVMTSLAGLKGSFGTNNGTGIQARFFDPKGIVYVPARDGLVVADSGNHLIRFVTLRGVVTTLAGTAGIVGSDDGPGTTAKFRFPSGLAADSNGNVYIADSKNNSIRKLDMSNVVSTLPGDFYEPAAVAVGDNGQIIVADTRKHSIKIIETNGTATLLAGSDSRYISGSDDSPFAVNALFNGPSGLLWLGGNSGLLVSDTLNHTLRRVYYNTNADVNGFSVETFAGLPGQPGLVNGSASVARFNNPIGLSRDVVSGGFLVVDVANNALRRIQTAAPLPPVQNPILGWVDFVKDGFGDLVSRLVPVTQSVFNNDVIIAVLQEAGTETFFTFGPTPASSLEDTVPSPSRKNGVTPPPYRDGLHPDEVPPSMLSSQPDMTIKVIGTQDSRRPSGIVQGRFQFKTGNPIVLGDNAASFIISNVTAGAQMRFTVDGSDPTADGSNPASIGPKLSGNPISLSFPKGATNLIFKVRAFRANYKPSEIVKKEFSPTDFVPNEISFGFEAGEASSEFYGAVGQHFYAPVTLTLLPRQTIYSLQFAATVTSLVGPPVAPGAVGFRSFLLRPVVFSANNEDQAGNYYEVIPPAMFVGYGTNLIDVGGGVVVTNLFGEFQDLLFTNSNAGNLLGVGWLERFGRIGEPAVDSLYNTKTQDLVTYSKPHDNLFLSPFGKVVLGAYSFLIPANATTSSVYQIQLDRPSATADGVSSDAFIESPVDGSLTNGPINSVKTVRLQSRQYVVGDVAPFRWFNAGDFGDTNLLNNDVLQVFQSAVYTLNTPPQDSDLFDAMDSSDGSTNKIFDGNDQLIDSISFGDGQLNVDDVFVTFRRSLDPSLKWFVHYWDSGVRVSVETTNHSRTVSSLISRRRSDAQANSPVAKAATSASASPSVVFKAGDMAIVPGQSLSVPLKSEITGDYPIRVLTLNLNVIPLNGAPALIQPVQFVPASGLGQPTLTSTLRPDNYAAAWLDNTVAGVRGA
ncbi:MAG: hypothetical protein ABI651_11565, partial [Verrucomicrobiota bacterium]